jgi:uncharacterized iron-regulated membrane protein
VAAGVVILAMSATGVVLAYQRQLTEWSVERRMTASGAATRLPLDTLVVRAAAAAPTGARLSSVTERADRRAPVAVGFEGRGPGAPRKTVYLDAATGAVLPGSPGLDALMAGATRLHRSLMIGRGTRSPEGAAVTGAANLAFFFLLLSGLYLWVPRRWTRRAVRAVALPARGARGRARDWNWHHVMGLWAAPGLAIVVGSAAFLSYRWPEQLVARLAGVPPRAEGAPGGRAGDRTRGAAAPGAAPPVRARPARAPPTRVGGGASAAGPRARRPALPRRRTRRARASTCWPRAPWRPPRPARGTACRCACPHPTRRAAT